MKRFNVVLFTIVTVLFNLNTVSAQSLPENHAVNGGVTVIPVDIKQKPEAYFNDKRIAVVDSSNPNRWLLIVGIPLDNKNNIQELTLKSPRNTVIPFHVSEKYYPTQSLTIPNKRKVDPYEQDRARINKETRKLAEIFSEYSKNNPFEKKFIAPSHGPISSLFGLKRVYNKQPRAPHSGLDIASPAGSAVKTIGQGKVVEAGDYFFTGNTVIVDHGQGVFSLYAHLNEIKAKKGANLKQGEIVGTVGQTGRVTGPHLHWTMVMNGNYVDPLLFVPAHTIRQIPKSEHKSDSQPNNHKQE